MAAQGSAGQPEVINLGGMVNEKIMDSIKQLDVLTVLQRMVASSPEDEESEEIREKLKGVMDKYYEMSPEDQETFTQQIRTGLANKIAARLQDPENPLKLDGLEDAIKSAVYNQLILVGVVGVIILFIIVFFGYKLFKSLRDKEKKKEEKRKVKQQKKKK